MVIIIEGCDNSGKTTIVNSLIKKFPGVMIKLTDRPVDDSLEEQNKIIRHYIGIIRMIEAYPNFEHVVLDRFFPSEKVYSIKRGYEAMNCPSLKAVEDFIINCTNHLLILCDPGNKTISDRMKKEPDDYVSEKENLEMLERYRTFFDKTKLNKIKVDTSKPIEKSLKIIEDKINEHKRHPQSKKGRQTPLFEFQR